MQYSPKLKKAAEEIKSILKKYDIAAHAVLHTPGFGEYLIEISPSYSCAKVQENGIRVRAKKSDFDGNTALRDKRIADTTNMFHHLGTIGGQNVLSLIQLSEELDKIVDADHQGGGHSSHQEQNN